jgi:hypothetical protein
MLPPPTQAQFIVPFTSGIALGVPLFLASGNRGEHPITFCTL